MTKALLWNGGSGSRRPRFTRASAKYNEGTVVHSTRSPIHCFRVISETKVSEKKKLSEKIKEKENREKRKKQEELKQVCSVVFPIFLRP